MRKSFDFDFISTFTHARGGSPLFCHCSIVEYWFSGRTQFSCWLLALSALVCDADVCKSSNDWLGNCYYLLSVVEMDTMITVGNAAGRTSVRFPLVLGLFSDTSQKADTINEQFCSSRPSRQ